MNFLVKKKFFYIKKSVVKKNEKSITNKKEGIFFRFLKDQLTMIR